MADKMSSKFLDGVGVGVLLEEIGKRTRAIVGNGSDFEGMKSVRYDEIVALRDGGQLVPGMKYRITDYEFTTTQADTRSAGHGFQVVVTALGADRLSEVACALAPQASVQDAGSLYFAKSNLAAWELRYCLDNDTERFGWADKEHGKGVIYFMRDEHGNEAGYDFKNALFRRRGLFGVFPTEELESDAVMKQELVSALFGDETEVELGLGEAHCIAVCLGEHADFGAGIGETIAVLPNASAFGGKLRIGLLSGADSEWSSYSDGSKIGKDDTVMFMYFHGEDDDTGDVSESPHYVINVSKDIPVQEAGTGITLPLTFIAKTAVGAMDVYGSYWGQYGGLWHGYAGYDAFYQDLNLSAGRYTLELWRYDRADVRYDHAMNVVEPLQIIVHADRVGVLGAVEVPAGDALLIANPMTDEETGDILGLDEIKVDTPTDNFFDMADVEAFIARAVSDGGFVRGANDGYYVRVTRAASGLLPEPRKVRYGIDVPMFGEVYERLTMPLSLMREAVTMPASEDRWYYTFSGQRFAGDVMGDIERVADEWSNEDSDWYIGSDDSEQKMTIRMASLFTALETEVFDLSVEGQDYAAYGDALEDGGNSLAANIGLMVAGGIGDFRDRCVNNRIAPTTQTSRNGRYGLLTGEVQTRPEQRWLNNIVMVNKASWWVDLQQDDSVLEKLAEWFSDEELLVFLNIANCSDNVFDVGCADMTFGDTCHGNRLGQNCMGNAFGELCSDNRMEDDCQDNLLEKWESGNVLEKACAGNVLVTNDEHCRLGAGCEYNELKLCSHVVLAQDCKVNKLTLCTDVAVAAPGTMALEKSNVNNSLLGLLSLDEG